MQAGFSGLDKRTAAGREYALKKSAIVADLGGDLSELQADLVERYLRTTVLIDSIDQWLFQQKSLINRRKKTLFPIVRERAQLVDSALRLATALGLERRAPQVRDLKEYLVEKAGES